MEQKEQKDPVAQYSFSHSTTSAVDLSDRDNEVTLVVKEEETYDTDALEEVEVGMVQLLKELQVLVEPPPGFSMSPPGSSV